MKKQKISGIIGGIIAIIIVGLIVLQFSFTDEGNISNDFNEPKIVDVDNDGVPDEEDPFVSAPRVWQSSGPFEIDRKQYALGELVLIRMNEIDLNEKGQIVFLQPSNGTHQTVYITIPFDGSEKFTFNQYFKPALSAPREICSKDDLIGNWTVVFQGTDYRNLEFEIVDRHIPGEEENYDMPVC